MTHSNPIARTADGVAVHEGPNGLWACEPDGAVKHIYGIAKVIDSRPVLVDIAGTGGYEISSLYFNSGDALGTDDTAQRNYAETLMAAAKLEIERRARAVRS